MRKALSILLAGLMLLALMAACVSEEPVSPDTSDGGNNQQTGDPTEPSLPTPPVASPVEEDPEMELVDGYWRFKETRPITVVIFERNNDVRTPAHDNVYTDFVKEGVLRDHNIEVLEYISIGRWEEESNLPLWLAGDDCPDVNLTYNFNAIQEYAGMGAVQDLAPIVDGYRDRLTNLWNLLGEFCIYYARNPETGEIFWIETVKEEKPRMNTFVREDWLTALSIPAPTSLQEFEDMLVAFRDNADKLLGAEADRMIPFSLGYDVGWRAENVIVSFLPSDMTTKELYIYGYDDRHMMYPNYKEGIRLLNKWYNDNLIWKDFAIYTDPGAGPEDDMMSTGYIGSFMHLWDYPYRGASPIQMKLQTEVGPEAAYIAVDPFMNDAGEYRKFNSPANDRKIFVPVTTTTGGGTARPADAKAAMFYCDWMSQPEVIQYLQLGEEGINYELVDGAPVTFAEPKNLDYIINSPLNLDLALTINGLYPSGITAKALAGGYAGIDSKYIVTAVEAAVNDGYAPVPTSLGNIESESGQSNAAKNKRDALLSNAVIAPVADFDSVYDAGMADYMTTVGQAIIDERIEKYEAAYGPDAD